MPIDREVSDNILIAVYHYISGVIGARQVSTPVIEARTEGRHCLKANVCTALKAVGNRIRRDVLVYLYNTSIRADIHGQVKTGIWSAGLSRFRGK